MPRRTLVPLLALGLAALLALPTGMAAAAQTPPPAVLTATIGDAAVTVSGPADVLAIAGPGAFAADIRVTAALADGATASSASVALDQIAGPAGAVVSIGGVSIAAGQSAPVAPDGSTTLDVAFPTAGGYALTLRITAEVAVIAESGVTPTSLASEPVVVEFDVAEPAPVPAPEAPSEGADAAVPAEEDPGAGDPAARAAIGPAPGLPVADSEGAGAAPAAKDVRVLAGIHTDTVSTFLDGGVLRLGSKADVEEGMGTRFGADDVWFHLDDDSAVTVPGGFDFIAPGGSTVWLAPETNPGGGRLWPGFSTESVPLGAIDGNQTTLTLTGFSGPGDLELYTTGGLGGVNRMWSSDEGIATFTLPRTHQHANWAFTAPGTYRIQVRATVSVGGAPLSDTAVYTFVVGGMPAPSATSTTLSVSDASPETGEEVTLTATVEPAGVRGYVEFRDGATALWHTPATGGPVTYTTDALPVGSRTLTAAFVPVLANDAAASVSAVSPVEVSEPGGTPFGVAGVEAEYEVGDVLTARVAGYTLREGEVFRWVMRPAGSSSSGFVVAGSGGEPAAGRFEQLLDAATDGYELSVQVRQGRTTVSQSAWSPVRVRPAAEVVTGAFPTDPRFLGDDVRIPLTGAVDPAHEVRLAYRYGGAWYAYGDATLVDGPAFDVFPSFAMAGAQWSVQVLDGGVVVAQSPAFAGDITQREALVEGIRAVYRDGQTLEATGTLYPELAGVTYEWLAWDGTGDIETLASGTGEDARRLSLPVDPSLDGVRLYFEAAVYRGGERYAVGWTSTELRVSTADPDEQLLFLETLSGHYHQGYEINLGLVADPALAGGDAVQWQWRWPGSEEWLDLPGATEPRHQLSAEQALDEVEVRAVVDVAGSSVQLVSDPATIHVDDHGSPARQVVSVSGETAVEEGADVTLSATSAAATVLTDVRWERRGAGEPGFSVLDGETEPEFGFTATAADDDAEYRVAFTTPVGVVAYGPSEHVTLEVTPAPPASGTRSIALTKGHIDLFEVTYDVEAGGLELGVKDDSGAYGAGSRFHDPADVTIFVDSELARMQAPGGAYGFLGEAGSEIYVLPFTQDPALPWPGWSTERLSGSLPQGTTLVTSADAVRLAVDIDGPGDVQTWMTGGFGTPINRYIDTVDPAADVIPISRNAHVHTAWAFTELGTYTVTVTPTATTTDGTTLTGPAATYRIHVGPAADAAPAAVESPAISGSGGVGETLTVDTGAWLPTPHALEPRWLVDGRPVEGATSESYVPGWSDLGHEISVEVTVGVGVATTVAESAPVLVVPGTAPTDPDDEPVAAEDLDEAPRGPVVLVPGTHRPGSSATLEVGEDRAAEWISVWLHSEPQWLGWTQVRADGTAAVTLPASAAVGEHRLVVKGAGGDLVGWTPITLTSPPPAAEPEAPPTAPANQCIAGATVLSAGHVDISSRIVGGRLQTLIGDDSSGSKVYREPSGTVLWLTPGGAVRLPGGLGQVGPEGSTAWIIPQTQKRDLVWLGWSTEGLGSATAASPVSWTITGISGPGSVKVYTTGSFGGVQSMIFDGTGSYDIPLGIHAHANWAFSAQGIYRITMTQSVVLPSGQRSSDTETLTIAVGDVDPATAARGGTGCGAVSTALFAEDGEEVSAGVAEALAAAGGVRPADREDDAPAAAAVVGAESLVPALLGVLVAVLLLAAGAAGVLLWRRRSAAG